MTAVSPHAPSPAGGPRDGGREVTRGSALVLLSAILALALGPSCIVVYTFGLFMQPIGADLGWDRASVSLLVSSLGIGIALGGPLKGYVVDRLGARALLLWLTPACGVLTMLIPRAATSEWLLYAAFAVLGLLAPGLPPFSKVIAEWFDRRRGMAYSVLGVGISLTVPIDLQVGRWLIDGFGWREAYFVCGLVQVAVSWPLLFAFFRSPGEHHANRAPSASARSKGPAEGLSLREAIRTRTYWLILGNVCLAFFVTTAFQTHGVAMLTDAGLSRSQAVNVISFGMVGSLAAQFAVGFLLDRFPTPRVVIVFSVLAAAGLVLLQSTRDIPLLMMASVIFSIGMAGELGPTQYFLTRYFGLRNFTVIYGSVQMVKMVCAAAIGPYVLGLIYDRTGHYALGFLILNVAITLAILPLAMLGRYAFGGAVSVKSTAPGHREDTPAIKGSAS